MTEEDIACKWCGHHVNKLGDSYCSKECAKEEWENELSKGNFE